MTAVPPVDALDGSLELDPDWTTSILSRFIDTELHRTGLNDLVLGLSGGIDSAVAAYLAAQAIEPARIHACLMPFRTSSDDSLVDARSVVDDLGIDSETIDISPLVDGFEKTAGKVDRLRLGNVMARARMTVLYDRSAAHSALVLGTSNKTELLLGYGTLHGDMASALNPIGDLYKTQLRRLAEHLGVPESIRTKPPSADLWPDQNDEDDLGFSYDEVDRLLALLIDARTSRATAIEAGFSPELIDGVTRRIVRSQFKRTLPVIAKISMRTIGWDFRYPRDWMT
jgi:NAD+ synthase